MALKLSDALANALLDGASLKTQLDGGFIYIFAGPVPATADAALDMTNLHTQLAKIAANDPAVDDGTVGLTFAAVASNRALVKSANETWAARVHFDGKDAGAAGTDALTATFYRHCAAGDNGRAAGSGSTPRIQGTVGVSGADMVLTNVALFDNNANTVGLATYEVRVDA